MKIKSRSEADQKQIKSFPAEAGPTVEAILEGVRGAFSGTGFSREEASSGADIFADFDRSHAPRGNASSDAPRPAKDAHQAGGVTRSVTGCIPTRSVGTIIIKDR